MKRIGVLRYFIIAILMLILIGAAAVAPAHQDALSPETGKRETYKQILKEMQRQFKVKHPEGLEEPVSEWVDSGEGAERPLELTAVLRLKTRGGRIKALRRQRGMTLRQLAKVAELSTQTVQHAEAGYPGTSRTTVRKIASALGVDEDILHPEDTKEIPERVMAKVMALPTIGARINALRDYRGWSLTLLSEKSGIERGTLSEIVSGKTKKIIKRTREKLARALGVNEKALVVETQKRPLAEVLPEIKTLKTRGEKIRAARKYRGLTLVQLEELSGVSKSTISNIENNQPASEGKVKKVIAALQMEPEVFAAEETGPGKPLVAVSVGQGVIDGIKEIKTRGERVQALLELNNWKQKDLAEAAGLAPKTIERVVANKRASRPTIKLIASALGVEEGLLHPKDTDGDMTHRAVAFIRSLREPGAGPTQAGVMPHRGDRNKGTVNDELVGTLVQCIESGELFKSCGGRLREVDVKPFMDWYEASEPGDDVEQLSRRIDIKKIAEPDIKIPAANGERLHVVKLPAGKLGMVDSKPFYGHISFREGIIWVAGGTGKDRDELDIEVDIMHEAEEYNIAAQKAKKWGWTMEQMAQWRDGKSAEHGGFNKAREFFNLAHVTAARRVYNKCHGELSYHPRSFLLPIRQRQKLEKAHQHFKNALTDHLEEEEEIKLLPQFGLALISSGKKDEDFETLADTMADLRKGPLERLAEEAKIDEAIEANEAEVVDFLLDYILRARQMEKSDDPAQKVEGMQMLRRPVTMAYLLKELKAFIAGKTKRDPEDITFRAGAFVEALKTIFSPAHIIDQQTKKPYSIITVGDLLEEPREPRTQIDDVERDEHLHRAIQLIKAYSDLLKGQGRGEIFDMLLSLMGLNITSLLSAEDVAQHIAEDYMPQPDIEVARAIVKAAIRRPFEYLPAETVTIDTEQIRATERIIETCRSAFKQGETDEETNNNINAARMILLDVMYGKITDEEAIASLLWHLDNPTRPNAAELVELAKYEAASLMLSAKEPIHQLQREVSQAI